MEQELLFVLFVKRELLLMRTEHCAVSKCSVIHMEYGYYHFPRRVLLKALGKKEKLLLILTLKVCPFLLKISASSANTKQSLIPQIPVKKENTETVICPHVGGVRVAHFLTLTNHLVVSSLVFAFLLNVS